MGFTDLLGTAWGGVHSLLSDSVTYSPGSGSPVTVDGIFDSAYVLVNLGEPGISSTGPAVYLLTADLPTDPNTDNFTVTYASVTYGIREVKKDNMGGVLILLHRTA